MIEPEDFLTHARILLSPSEENIKEIDLRSSISRSYYYLYHRTYEHLKERYRDHLIKVIDEILLKRSYKEDELEKVKELDMTFLKSNVNLHSVVVKTLIVLGRDKSRDFKSFRDYRNEADYNLCKNFEYADVIALIDEMEQFAKSLK